jgi:hydrogenase maturation protease
VTELQVIVLGLGNVLLQDDGAGVEAITRLCARYESPAGLRVLDGGTLGLSLLPWIRQARALVLVDAVTGDAPPGTLVRLDGDEVPAAVLERLSPHQVGVADLLFGARVLGGYPEEVVLVGIVAETLGLGTERSASVEARIDGLVDAVLAETVRLGFPMVARAAQPQPTKAGEAA